eukprot:XP_024458598.1 nuclear pore complex protein NUP85 [Populus trichocarpa]
MGVDGNVLCRQIMSELVTGRLVDWLADYDSLLSGDQLTVHSKLVEFQGKLVTLQAIEDDPKYWEVISSDTSSWLARDCGETFAHAWISSTRSTWL